MEEKRKHAKRRVVLVALAACLTVVAAGGVLAWFSAQSNVTNNFVVGNINPPTTDPTDPSKPIDPDHPTDPDNPDKPNLDGNLYEPSWVDGSKIGPGATIAKDPYVGTGKGSETAYVYVYVKNNMGGGSHFKLNAGWAAVDATEYTVSGAAPTDKYYTGGLFVYGTAAAPAVLTAAVDKDAWTTEPVFDAILTPANASIVDTSTTIDVHAYVAAKSSAGETFADLETAARAWAAALA